LRRGLSRAFLLALFLLAPVAGGAEEVSLLQGALRFTLPAGYTRLSEEELAAKFPRNNRPPFAAFGNQRRNATIAFTISKQENPFTEEKLPEFMAAMEKILPRMVAGLAWHKREVVTLQGRKWARLHFTAHAVDTDIKNAMYFTPFRGDILGVNLNATVAGWDKAAPAMTSAFGSIRLER
jgi:hypothetical protein